MILDLRINYHREIIPNISCPWTIDTLSYGIYIGHLYIGYCFQLPYLSPKMYLFSIPLSSVTFVIPFDFVNLVLCYFYVGRCDDPTCVHFLFKCKIVNNALILGELSYICYNTLCVLISIGIGFCWKTNLFFFGT
jgi:hypothetical protein